MIKVTWWGAVEYCNWLSEKTNLPKAYNSKGELIDAEGNTTTNLSEVIGYRLPTQSEWEYAAGINNGNDFAGSSDLDEVGWYWKNSGDKYLEGEWDQNKIKNNNCKTHAVGEKEPNQMGLYDMSGNVWEWTTSPSQSQYVYKGGSWFNKSEKSLISTTQQAAPNKDFINLGFRPVKSN